MGIAVPAPRTRCLSCDADGLREILSLGSLPLPNAYPAAGAPADEPRFPLDVAFCPGCSLVQLRHIVAPEHLFSEYLYFSSYSTSMLQHAEALAATLVAERRLGPERLVVEVASNDGYLLQYFQKAGVQVLGIEPAANIAAVAERDRHIPTITEFFGHELATRLRGEGKRADVLLGLNVMAHVPDLNGFMSGIATMLAPGGIAVIEAPYVRDMVERTEFDTIYHEHLCYFSVHAVAALVRRHGLVLERVERVPIHGGSLRFFISPGTAHGETTERLLQEEEALGLTREDYYRDFRMAVERVRDDLNQTLGRLRASGATIGAYGAAAKGTILLNYCGITPSTVAFVADRSPYKQGRRMPGCGIPVVGPDVITERQPDYLLILIWNLKDEVVRQEDAYRQRGGRFILAVPRIELQ
ncbi:MAG TPA: class I SAM-dependent methyltransferase [Vicinamibacterales bacterium]|nr:class I SAM-dependent methyltransferase [Vicinamibacterales bacterium]